jgi:hypothetical protein
MPANLVIF